jgi:hypothetical protein
MYPGSIESVHAWAMIDGLFWLQILRSCGSASKPGLCEAGVADRRPDSRAGLPGTLSLLSVTKGPHCIGDPIHEQACQVLCLIFLLPKVHIV